MTILFDRDFPNSLLKALRLILNIEEENAVTVAFFDSSFQDTELEEHPVAFLFNNHRTGIDPQIRVHVDAGYRVFAYRLAKGSNYTLSDIAMTVVSVFPKALEHVQNIKEPFLFTIRHKGSRFTRVALKPRRRAEPPSSKPAISKPKQNRPRKPATRSPHDEPTLF